MKKFLMFFASILFLSCTSGDNLGNRIDSSVSKLENSKYKIKHLTLEELNSKLVANGLNSITLEELGVTQLEYENGQKGIVKNNLLSREICPQYCDLTAIAADANADGLIDYDDHYLVQQKILALTYESTHDALYLDCVEDPCITSFSSCSNATLNSDDLVIISKLLLGIHSCSWAIGGGV